MMDVEFFLAPEKHSHVIYRHRSDGLLQAFRDYCRDVVMGYGDVLRQVEIDWLQSQAVLFGLPTSVYCEVLSRNADISDDLELLRSSERAFVAVPFENVTFSDGRWEETRRSYFVLEEPLVNRQFIEQIVEFALRTSDLRPGPEIDKVDLGEAALAREVPDLSSFWPFLDEYILLGPDVARRGTAAHRIPGLSRSLQKFIDSPHGNTRKRLLEDLLSRTNDIASAMQDLVLTTNRLLKRTDRNGSGSRQLASTARWAVLLVTRHPRLRAVRPGSMASWRGGADLRLPALDELLDEFERLEPSGDEYETVISMVQEAADEMRLVDPDTSRIHFALMETLKASPDARVAQAATIALTKPSLDMWTLPLVPGGFDGVQGNEQAIFRMRYVNQGQHQGTAFLLVGSDSSEKSRLASAQANAILCRDRHRGGACGNCESCRDFFAGRHSSLGQVDLRGLDAQVQIERLDQVAALSTMRSIWDPAAMVINGVDMVVEGILDRLLKIVEDAPRGTSFIFLAESLSKVPLAIRSRSLGFKLKPMLRGAADQGTDRQM